MEALRIFGYVGLIGAIILAISAKDQAAKIGDETQAIVLYLQCENTQAINRSLIHVLEALITDRQIDLLYADTNSVTAWANTQISILTSEATQLRASLTPSCLGKWRHGNFGPHPVIPPDYPHLNP